jgi:histidine triad (HIT) family protein|tara:strand:- start:74 stop:436 length:363 start_codon:yes stop_codon:yes gene_type:complete
MSEDCIFCKIREGELPNEKVIHENDNFFSIFDVAPQVEGHALIISKRHFETVLDLPGSLGQELLDCIKNTALILIKEKNVDGFNIVQNNFESAGQVVKHFHVHILPREKDDECFLSLEKK